MHLKTLTEELLMPKQKLESGRWVALNHLIRSPAATRWLRGIHKLRRQYNPEPQITEQSREAGPEM